MLKNLAAATAAVLATAICTSPASADDARFACDVLQAQQDTLTGQSHEGLLAGYAVAPSGGPVTLRCTITVNGVTVGADAVGTGPGVAVASKDAWYWAAESDRVLVCATATHNSVTATQCVPVLDAPVAAGRLLRSVPPLVDSALCPVLGAAAGDYGGVSVDPSGDVHVGPKLVWDCPLYAG